MPDSTLVRSTHTTWGTFWVAREPPLRFCRGTLRCGRALLRVGAGRILCGISDTTNCRGATIGPQDDCCYGGRPDRPGAAGGGFAGARPCGYWPRREGVALHPFAENRRATDNEVVHEAAAAMTET